MRMSARNAYLYSVASDADARNAYFGTEVASRIATIEACTYVNGNGATAVSAWDITTADGKRYAVRVGETLPTL